MAAALARLEVSPHAHQENFASTIHQLRLLLQSNKGAVHTIANPVAQAPAQQHTAGVPHSAASPTPARHGPEPMHVDNDI